MPATQTMSFAGLVEHYLGTRLPEPMASSVSFPDLVPETQKFIIRMLELMRRANYTVTGFTPHLIQWMSVTAPNILPGAWGGRIPPLTLPGRHKKLDERVALQVPPTGKGHRIFVDLGCGFPPVTTTDTARRFSDWHIYGVDRSFSDYVLYDNEGHYACFDRNGEFQYFQAFMHLSGRAMYAEPQSARKRFENLFKLLLPLLKETQRSSSQIAEKDGNRLIYNHIRDFEADNLTFIESEIKDLRLPPARVIRCMNVLIYFTPEKRKTLLKTAGRSLEDDGILIAGTNGIGIQLRYAIYQKRTDGIYASEFAFSLDNLGPIVFMPWFTIHENDPESILLAKVMCAVRSDRSFWSDFNSRIDELLKHNGICERGSDGFLHFPERPMAPAEYLQKNADLWQQMEKEGYGSRVVESLRQCGYEAWKNTVGDIAIRPSTNDLP